MINQELLDFIRKQSQSGLNEETISKELLSGGWAEQDIEEGFNVINFRSNITHIEKITIYDAPKSIYNKRTVLILIGVFLLTGALSAYYFRDGVLGYISSL